MKLKGLSIYDITDDEGRLNVRNIKSGRIIRIQESNTLQLRTDKARSRNFSVGAIRFLMKNPEINVDDIHPSIQGIRFAEDGKVIDLYDRRFKWNTRRFKGVDDMLTTVLAIKAATQGDLEFLYRFIAEHREDALNMAANILKKRPHQIREFLPEGEEEAVRSIVNANFSMITPLLHMYGKAIARVAGAALSSRKSLIENDKSRLHLSSHGSGEMP